MNSYCFCDTIKLEKNERKASALRRCFFYVHDLECMRGVALIDACGIIYLPLAGTGAVAFNVLCSTT